MRPVERKPVSYEPVGDVGVANRTHGDGPPILIEILGQAGNGFPGEERGQVVRGLLTATVELAVIIVAGLITFRRIDPEQADTEAVNFDGIAVNDGGLPHEAVCKCRRRSEEYTNQEGGERGEF